MDEEVRELRRQIGSYRIAMESGKVPYRKWRSQRTYMHDPWT